MKQMRLTHSILFLALFPVWSMTILLTLLVVMVGITEIDGALKVRGTGIVRQLAPASEYGAFSGNREVLQALTQAVMREVDAKSVMIVDPEHKTLAIAGTPGEFIRAYTGMVESAKIVHDGQGSLSFAAPIYQEAAEGNGFDLLDQASKIYAKKPKLLGVVFLELNTETSQHSKNMFILISLLIGCLGTAGATILALRMSRDVTAPLSVLLDSVNQMAQGQLKTRIKVNSAGELAELERGFNLMASKLQSGHDELQKTNVNLENLVAIRTQQLKERNLELEQLSTADQLSRAKAEEATSIKSNFLAVASHDLRQPMHALNLYLGVLSDYALPEPARPILSNVKQCAQAMDEMFRELLDISRLDAHMVVAEMQAFPLAMLLGQIQMEFAPQAKAKGLSLHVVPCSLWVRSDPALLERILRNFVSNAVRYTSQGKILIGCRRRESGVSLMVCDTGQGIAPEQQTKIFDEFYQVYNPERDRSQGLGLGLATVQRLANLLNARLSLSSTLGRGAVFAIDLPLATAADAMVFLRTISSAKIAHDAQGALIVVIDDERLILNATKTLLEHWGYSVVAATSEADLMLQLGNAMRVPDAIVCDNRLRDNALGTDVIASLRNEFNQDIPALLITGDTSRERLLAIEASGIEVLFKPLQENVLRESLTRLIADVQNEKNSPQIQ